MEGKGKERNQKEGKGKEKIIEKRKRGTYRKVPKEKKAEKVGSAGSFFSTCLQLLQICSNAYSSPSLPLGNDDKSRKTC